jgi:hypothetical protein
MLLRARQRGRNLRHHPIRMTGFAGVLIGVAITGVQMDQDDARCALDDVLVAADSSPERRARAVQRILIEQGTAAFCIAAASLHQIICRATQAPQSSERRAFAVLLVHALRIKDAVRPRSKWQQFDRDVCTFVESALLNPLRRAGYPFSGSTYDKMQFLSGLHATLDEHMKPLEPTFPAWLSGLPNTRQT